MAPGRCKKVKAKVFRVFRVQYSVSLNKSSLDFFASSIHQFFKSSIQFNSCPETVGVGKRGWVSK